LNNNWLFRIPNTGGEEYNNVFLTGRIEMPEKKHPAWPEELARLDYTLDYVQKSLEETERRESFLAEEVRKSGRHVSSESSQEFINQLINARIYESTKLKLRNLEGARSKPYFARIDFHEADRPEKEKLYIGKMCLMRDEDKQMVIVDWRAPIANLYYEGRLGEAG
jgi:DNA helicase-2/ATP-dependent DNA helicase PcrA